LFAFRGASGVPVDGALYINGLSIVNGFPDGFLPGKNCRVGGCCRVRVQAWTFCGWTGSGKAR